jgi:rod shape-determining protein MreD
MAHEDAMRTATLVLVAYLMCVAFGAIWRLLPWIGDAIPDLGALTAAYLGLTARRQVAPAIGGAIALGYLIDLISGAPPGLAALVLALTTLVARAVQQRILVRGATLSIAFSAFIALVAGVLALIVRIAYQVPTAAFAVELNHVALMTIATAIVGPLVWRLFRRIDAAFARTHRERDAALEGVAP